MVPAWNRHRHRYHWSPSHTWGRALRVPCSCSCPLSFPPAWHLAAPRLGDTATLRPHTASGGLADWGGTSSQPAGRTKIPSLQLALPSISGHSFLMIPLDLSPIARTGALGQPTSLLPQYHSTGTSIQGSCRQGWVWGKRILLVYSRCTHSLMSALSARHPSSHAATWPRDPVSDPVCGALACPSQAVISRCRLSAACAWPKSRLERSWSLMRAMEVRNHGPDAATLPPVSLSFPPKNPLWKSVCVPDTSLTTQTSLTGRESLNFTSALVTDGPRTARAPQGT